MRRYVHLEQVLRGHPGVHLCRRNCSVTEQLLDGPEIGSPLHHMRGCRMAQYVGRNSIGGDSGPISGFADDPPQTLPTEAPTPQVEEKRPGVPA